MIRLSVSCHVDTDIIISIKASTYAQSIVRASCIVCGQRSPSGTCYNAILGATVGPYIHDSCKHPLLFCLSPRRLAILCQLIKQRGSFASPPPHRGVQSIVMSMSVCLSDCSLFVCALAQLIVTWKRRARTSPNFMHVACGHDSTICPPLTDCVVIRSYRDQ